jgi:large subunit ribosomal protein L5
MEKLVEKYNKTIISELKSELSKKNIMEVPKLVKVVISSGVGDFKEDDKAIQKISGELAKITGLKPKINRSRKAVSAFKLRIGQPVGLTITLHGEKMFDFLDRLVSVAFPRVRDFRGLPKRAFDGQGNYSIGLKDYSIFPEIKYEDATTPFGFQVNIKTNCKNNADAEALLLKLGFPFEKKVVSTKTSPVAPAPKTPEIKEEPVAEEIVEESNINPADAEIQG